MGIDTRKPITSKYRVCDQQRRRPACACVIRVIESIISKLITSEISIFYLVDVAQHAGLGIIELTVKAAPHECVKRTGNCIIVKDSNYLNFKMPSK